MAVFDKTESLGLVSQTPHSKKSTRGGPVEVVAEDVLPHPLKTTELSDG